jgi:hypothetical protein
MNDDKVVALHGGEINTPDKTLDVMFGRVKVTEGWLTEHKIVAVGCVVVDEHGYVRVSFAAESSSIVSLMGAARYLELKIGLDLDERMQNIDPQSTIPIDDDGPNTGEGDGHPDNSQDPPADPSDN